MSEWKAVNSLQDLAAAQAAGEEIVRLWKHTNSWTKWSGDAWDNTVTYRSRPAKKTKAIVLRTALISNSFEVTGTKEWIEKTYGNPAYYFNTIQWLDTPERIVEIE